MWSWISAPGLGKTSTTRAFRVGDLKSEGGAFLRDMASILRQGAGGEEEGALAAAQQAIEVPSLRLVSMDEELEVLRHTPAPARAVMADAQGAGDLGLAGQQQKRKGARKKKVQVQEGQQQQQQQEQQQQQQQQQQEQQQGSGGASAAPPTATAAAATEEGAAQPAGAEAAAEAACQPAERVSAGASAAAGEEAAASGAAAEGAPAAGTGPSGAPAAEGAPGGIGSQPAQESLVPGPVMPAAALQEAEASQQAGAGPGLEQAGSEMGAGQQQQAGAVPFLEQTGSDLGGGQQQQPVSPEAQPPVGQETEGAPSPGAGEQPPEGGHVALPAAAGPGPEQVGQATEGEGPAIDEEQQQQQKEQPPEQQESGAADEDALQQQEPSASQGAGARAGRERRPRKRPAYLREYALPDSPPAQRGQPAEAQRQQQPSEPPSATGAGAAPGAAAAAQLWQPPVVRGQGPPAARGPKLPEWRGPSTKEERLGLLEAYSETVEGVKRRRREALAAAGEVLHSVRATLGQPMPLIQSHEETAAKILKQRLEEALVQRLGAAPEDLVPKGEVVLHVSVQLPQSAASQPSQELLLLGSQPLTALRDAIHCLTDVNVAAAEEHENAARAAAGLPPVSLAKPSAYLYVEGTFYNDMRAPGAQDYSEPIRRFNRENMVQAPPHPQPGSAHTDQLTTEFSTARMEATTFEQLWLRLGPGAVNIYCHQGGCEHAVVFKDVRLFDADTDPPLAAHYPFQLQPPALGTHRQCEVCALHPARKVTYDDPQTPHTPFFWCDDCYKLMHYDEAGRATYTDYRVFPYSYELREFKSGGGGGGGAGASGAGRKGGQTGAASGAAAAGGGGTPAR